MEDIVISSLNKKSKDNRYKEIFIEDIFPSEFNKYPMEEIESLANNIAECGLLHPINVIQKNESSYEICSGERRYRAMKLLYDQGNEDYEMIPAIVKINDLDDRLMKRRIRRGNATRPELSVEQKIEITKESLQDYLISKENGEIPVGVLKRDWIAADTGFSTGSVQSYLNIIDGKQDSVTKKTSWKDDPILKSFSDDFKNKLKTKVVVSDKEIKIKYSSKDELRRILEQIYSEE